MGIKVVVFDFLNKIRNYKYFKTKVKPTYWLTRFVFLRFLGFVYLFAFLSLVFQVIPLIGDNGLLPADNYLEAYGSRFETKTDAFFSIAFTFLA